MFTDTFSQKRDYHTMMGITTMRPLRNERQEQAMNAPLSTKESRSVSDFLPTLMSCLDITGAGAVSIIDRVSGTLIEAHGETPYFREIVERVIEMTRVRFCRSFPLDEAADDILMTTRDSYQILTFLPAPNCAGLFVFLVLQRPEANLAFARHKVGELVKQIELSPEMEQNLCCLRKREEQHRASKDKLFLPEANGEDMEDDELPPFMRLDNVMKLLNM